MPAAAPIESPLPTVVAEGARAYIGYRRAGAAVVRRPSGESVSFPADAPPALLAGVVLADRLGHRAPAALAAAFGREWVDRRAHGEFVWPVTAVDEWLASQTRTDARPHRPRPYRALEHALGAARAALPRTLAARHPNTVSPRGGH